MMSFRGHAEVEEWQARCSALEADAHKAERLLAEELQLKAEELTSSLRDLEATRKGQTMAQELAESLEKSYKELNSEYSSCHAELSEAKQEAERLRQLQPRPVQQVQPQPTSAPRASLVATQAGEPATLGSTVAALRRARASLAGEAIERLPQQPQQAQANPGSPSRDVSAGLKALQRLKLKAAAGKAKAEAGAESPQSSPSGSKAASLIASRSKADRLCNETSAFTSRPIGPRRQSHVTFITSTEKLLHSLSHASSKSSVACQACENPLQASSLWLKAAQTGDAAKE